MKPDGLILSDAARRGYYPTPPELADRLLDGIKLWEISRILEPSAGNGNLVAAVARNLWDGHHGRWRHTLDVDCVELDPMLRAALKAEWCEKLDALKEQRYQMDRSGDSSKEPDKYRAVLDQIGLHETVNVRIVHDDFITFSTFTPYGLILMNPPFEYGDLHLLRALKIMEQNGGEIRCLLNAETIRNPYNVRRRLLKSKLEELGAEIEVIPNAFRDAERETDVEVALIKITVPAPERGESEFFQNAKKAAEVQVEADPELRELITTDYLQAAVQSYNVEVAATMRFYREYRNLVPYMRRDLTEKDADPLIKLQVFRPGEYGYTDFEISRYMRAVRLKYWKALLHNPKFTGKLTSKLAEEYRQQTDRMADYEFSTYNIQQLYLDMSAAMSKGIEAEILELFETLTVKYANYPECKTTVWLYNGWRTNKAHKVGPKVILPRTAYDYSYFSKAYEFSVHRGADVLADIEKSMDYLAAEPMETSLSLFQRLEKAKEGGQSRNVDLKWFLVDFYKKGTMHIKFKPEAMPVVDRLNIFGSQKRGWLPPDYGKKAYQEMDAEERAVVDSFHGDGTNGSGAGKYAEVLTRRDYYLSEPTRNLPALMAAKETETEE